MSSTCRLCRTREAELKESHIVPNFVGKYLKATSGTGFLTSISASGEAKRAQDLFKTRLLCNSCEQRLEKHETFVASKIFKPYKDGTLQSIPIDEHIGKFTVSVSLRALWVLADNGDVLVKKWWDKLLPLEAEWRSYLLEDTEFKKGQNTHHMLLSSSEILVAGLKTTPKLVLGIFRTSAWYIDEQFGKAFIFSNMAGLQTLSMISPEQFPVSRGTQVYPKQTFGVEHPCGIGWGGYFQTILGLTRRFDAAGEAITNKHKAMIERSIKNDPERALQSEDQAIIDWQKRRRRDGEHPV